MTSIAYYDRLCQEDLDTGVDVTSKRNPGGGTLTATQVGIHTFAIGQVRYSATWDPGSVASGGYVAVSMTVTGAELGDFTLASFSLNITNLNLSSYVSAAKTVTVVLSNLTGTAVDLEEGTLHVLVFKARGATVEPEIPS